MDSSPESSENGTEAPLTPKGEGEFTVWFAYYSPGVTFLPHMLV